MRLWAGYSQVSDPEFKSNNGIEERDFFKCCHCGSYEFVVPKQTDFTRCYSCDDGMGGGLICKKCVGKPCLHFMKKIEMQEDRARFRSWI